MGFRRDDAVQWYGGTLANLEENLLIVTFAGSPTVKDSWVNYLRKYAQLEAVKQEIVVCNAGHSLPAIRTRWLPAGPVY